MNKAIPPCKNTAAKIAVDFHLSDAKVAAAMYTQDEEPVFYYRFMVRNRIADAPL